MKRLAVSEADRRARERRTGTPMRVLLAVDVSYQTYRAAAAHPGLTSRRAFTGGLFGFFTTIAKMIRETRATDIVFCTDSRPYVRSNTYPEYKQLRKATRDEELYERAKESMELVMQALTTARMPVWTVRGFESDDLIGHAVCRYRCRYDLIYAGSNDSDLYQLLVYERFRVYRQSITDVVTRASLLKKTGLTPDQFMLASALQGTHNDIAGIAGVGVKTAARAVQDPGLLRKYMDTHRALVERNLALIKLPHAALPADTRMPASRGMDLRELWRVLSHYDIDVTGAMQNSFDQVQR